MRLVVLIPVALLLGGCDPLAGFYDAYLDPDPGTEGYDPDPPKEFGTPIGAPSHQVSCDPMHGFVVGSTWFSIYDGQERKYDKGEECTQEWLSESFVERLDPEAQDESTGKLLNGPGCRVRWTGSVTDFDGASYAAVGLIVTTPKLEEYSGLLIKTRGDGRVYRLKFPQKTQIELHEKSKQKAAAGEEAEHEGHAEGEHDEDDCNDEHLDFHGIDMACGNGTDEWVTREIPFKSLEQEGWGLSTDLDLSDVGQVQLFTRERPIDEFQCDVAVVGLRR